ncbi:hypothetical protein J4G43_053345 (plasmid) [Bradyrhizobium barranii subsp. barranii]|uniref:Uncharacterized protein n=1 Tax=Bradyrhizobium barranii subsp. barranii TaxID=2823807 RepID=A0A939MHN8_9BRAD|nr:hypothetical protein [Bradyrhizobium barranii]UEM18000.1 hypothetical protein J4G43_053345 [Bradyrhizobium barranii subsp. barranii]
MRLTIQTPPSPNGAKTGTGGPRLRPSARGEKLDTEIRSTLMRCGCRTTFDSWKPAESYPHRAHITAAQAANGTRR